MEATKKSTQREPSLLCNSQMNVSAGEQMRRLGNRWVFDCANRLITDENMERKRAFQQAAKAYHLLEQLGKGRRHKAPYAEVDKILIQLCSRCKPAPELACKPYKPNSERYAKGAF